MKQKELTESVSELKEQLSALTKEVNEAYVKLNDLNKEIEIKQHEKELVDSELNEKKDRITSLDKKIDDLNNKYLEAKNAVESKNSELEVLETLNNEYTEKLSKNKAEISKLNSDINEKNDQISNLSKDLANLKKQLSDYGDDTEIAKHVWEDLDREFIDMSEKDSSLKPFKEADWLEEFKDNLKSNGILFPDRTINAFHTGLKAADSSPLLVLAGISGTGKSLLPQLYAKASGMNFIPVAVQPRWDSPQDMLGFYNYMQNRYKATELSRLLWQFDYFNNPRVEKSFDNQGDLPMNLILLDEMNLARVEYYFSDMLSKLEVRRTIDEWDSESRFSAEIEIECGSISGVANSRRLFVGRNNLFVGTMNEDETTQSLSDKVVDRSNVLRFGKPENLQSKPNIDRFRENYEDICYLTLEHWNQNRSIPSAKVSEELRMTMDSINTALEKVNRPFAHRVWQSVENYVNSYPNVSNKANYNNALSDQVEMKILPKLNGLPKDSKIASEALDEIGYVINKIGDEKLSYTYNAVKEDQENMFFQWKGVVR
jgi:Chromosome segregation ATPases